jgi:nicotinamide-nucleotide amidase
MQPIHHRVIHTTGVPESRLSEMVTPLLPDDMGPVGLAFLPDRRGVDLRLTAHGVPAAEAGAALDRVEAVLEPAVARWRFEASSGDIVEALQHELLTRGMTVATAESCTGGLIAQRITGVPGSSAVFLGGIVAYSNAVKVADLGVTEDDLATHGAVSEVVARQMALGARDRFGASTGIGITGVAGPGGGSKEKPVGTVWLAIAVGADVHARVLTLPGDRSTVREWSAQAALSWLYRHITGREGGT